MKRSDLENELYKWSKANEKELGYLQEWKIKTDAYDKQVQISVYEADDGHLLAVGEGLTLEDACDDLVAEMPSCLEFWGLPTEFPV